MPRITLALFAAAMIAAVRVWTLDWHLNVLRVPGTPDAAYRVSPFRWRRRLYTGEAVPVLRKIWRAIWVFYVCGFLAVVSFAVAAA